MYTLHQVIVHSGEVSAGHYYVYIKPDPFGTSWFKFDDDRVTPALDREVFEENFGSDSQMKPTSAYVLVYVRACMMDQVLAPVTASDVPPALSTSFSFCYVLKRILKN
jgi:ubiquitin carboxyl-terminal hydrolase 7